MDLTSWQERRIERRVPGQPMPGERIPMDDPREFAGGGRRIEVEVGELVFHGFSAKEARRLAASLEQELREYLATELSGELLRDVDGDLAPQLAEGIRKALGMGLGNHRSGAYRREHHGT